MSLLLLSWYIKGWIIELCVFPSLQIKSRNTHPENMCEIIFERRKVVVGQLTEWVIMQKQRFEAFYEDKVLWENL